MIKVNISTIDERKSTIVDAGLTPKQILNQEGINYQRATLMLDGLVLDAGTANLPLADLHIVDECYLAVSIKMDNA